MSMNCHDAKDGNIYVNRTSEFIKKNMKSNTNISQKELKELVHYNPITGDFLRFKATSQNTINNPCMSTEHGNGYLKADIKGKTYFLHRLAFLYMEGEIPDEVDHINHNRKDNSWVNLRAVSRTENCKNSSIQSNNTSGCVGVSFNKKISKWTAYIKVEQKKIHLGCFIDKDDAIKARKEAEVKYEFHENHGK